jgi:hypothetical protein
MNRYGVIICYERYKRKAGAIDSNILIGEYLKK